MSDHLTKFVRKLAPKQREQVLDVLRRVRSGDLVGLDVKKMVGKDGLFRVRVGRIRIIFGDGNEIVDVDFRGNIYKK